MTGDPTSAWPARMVALVPVYNHHAQVGAVVRGLRALGAPVLVVDDGSTDGSGDEAAAAGAELHRLPTNRGKGEALRAGLALAAERGYAQALSCDADGQHPPEAAIALARSATETEAMHVGRREMRSAPRVSRFGRWWSNLWVWICCGWWVGDSQSGLRVYPLPATSKLPVRAGHYAWEVEVLVRAAWAGLPVRFITVPVIYPPDRVSHFHAARDNLRTSLAFHRLVWRRLLPWPHRKLVTRRRVPLRARLREVLTANLSPWQVAGACALGAALGVAPLPGLQMASCVWLAWLLRLNVPLTLLVSNHSFGPMLAVWYALATAIGLNLLTGVPLSQAMPDLHHRLHDAVGWPGILAVLRDSFASWLLGCALLMVVLGLVAGFLGFLVAEVARARRRR
jgi:glycosyltransferase involved in cell wall biosynthesis